MDFDYQVCSAIITNITASQNENDEENSTENYLIYTHVLFAPRQINGMVRFTSFPNSIKNKNVCN